VSSQIYDMDAKYSLYSGLTKAMNTGIAEIQHGVQELNIAQTGVDNSNSDGMLMS